MGLVPRVLAAVGLKVIFQARSVVAGCLPHLAVADLKEQHAVAVLVEQVAVALVVVDEIVDIVLEYLIVGIGLHLAVDIAGSGCVAHKLGLGVDLAGQHRCQHFLLAIGIAENGIF